MTKPAILSVLRLACAALLAALAAYTALDLSQSAENPYRGRRFGTTTPYSAGLPFR
jgi:hypothetical protein